jgi:hypothetical protein
MASIVRFTQNSVFDRRTIINIRSNTQSVWRQELRLELETPRQLEARKFSGKQNIICSNYNSKLLLFCFKILLIYIKLFMIS